MTNICEHFMITFLQIYKTRQNIFKILAISDSLGICRIDGRGIVAVDIFPKTLKRKILYIL